MRANIRYELLKIQNEQSKPISPRDDKAGKKVCQRTMAKYVPMELLVSLSGKVCGHSDMYFANRKGTLYTGKICNPYKGEPSALQIA